MKGSVLMSTIQGTFELVGGTSQGLSTGDLVVMGTAILSFIGVIVSVFLTNKMSKKINEDNNEFQKNFNETNNQLQEKLNQKNIDATLKAKARIEWIQNVRDTSAELISLYYQLLNSTDNTTLFNTFIAAQEKTELLILFLGPETKKQNQETIPPISLGSLESNEGKNDLIVEFLSKLNNDFYLYYNKALKNEKSILEEIRKKRLERVYGNPIGYIEHEPSYDHEGNEISHNEPIWDKDLLDEVSEIEGQNRENTLFTSDLNKRLIELRNIIRIYLKIEWNKAKNGK